MLHLFFFVCITLFVSDFALVAEQVDAADLKSVVRKDVPVRFRPSAPLYVLSATTSVAFFVSS